MAQDGTDEERALGDAIQQPFVAGNTAKPNELEVPA
jgi:hypothetical protein